MVTRRVVILYLRSIEDHAYTKVIESKNSYRSAVICFKQMYKGPT